MRRSLLFLSLVLGAYLLCWFTTVPEIHRRQTEGAIRSAMPERSLPIPASTNRNDFRYGTLNSRAYVIVPFYYHGQVSRRFGEQDGYPEVRRYVGIGRYLLTLHGEAPML